MRSRMSLVLPARAVVAFAATFGILASDLPAQSRTVVRTKTVDQAGRDSTVNITVSVDPGAIMRLVAELLASRQVEERIAMSLRELRGDRLDAGKLREMETELSSVARRNAGMLSAIKLQCAREDDQPDGYLGVSFAENIEVRRVGDGPAMYNLGTSPRILSIEPGSPAQRSGLEANDALIAIAGHDARRPLPLGSLLKSGSKLVVRVSRGGQARDVTVTVAKRPSDYGSPCGGVDDMVASIRMPQATFVPRSGGQSPLRTSTVITGTEGVVSPRGSGFVFVAPYAASGPNLIGGAQFLALDAQWRETLGVDRGLLVLTVAAGSPAEAAGLRKSDVIVAAGDATVHSVGALWQMVNRAGADPLQLTVLRAKQPVTIVFRAREPR